MKKSSYVLLDEYEREVISRGLVRGYSYTTIALSLKRRTSTIIREVERNGGPEKYCGDCAQRESEKRISGRKKNKRKIVLNPKLEEYVQKKLLLYWSPEQTANRLRLEYPQKKDMHVVPETIYGYVYALPKGELRKLLIKSLRQKHQYRRQWGDRAHRAQAQPDRANIEERPQSVEVRKIPGHWEGDLVMGKRMRSGLGTLVERKTRFTLLVPLKSLDSPAVMRAFSKALKGLPEHVKRTLTCDQGSEFARYRYFEKLSGAKVYFTHRKSPWERGTNENTNGLVRQFFPKGTDFADVSSGEVRKAQDLLNGRPRKVLSYHTPTEKINKILH